MRAVFKSNPVLWGSDPDRYLSRGFGGGDIRICIYSDPVTPNPNPQPCLIGDILPELDRPDQLRGRVRHAQQRPERWGAEQAASQDN